MGIKRFTLITPVYILTNQGRKSGQTWNKSWWCSLFISSIVSNAAKTKKSIVSINITSSLLILTLTCVQVIRTSAINEYFTQSVSVYNFADVCVNPHQIASVAVIFPKLRGKASLRSSWLHFLACQHNCEWYLEIKTLHWRHVVRDDWPCYSLVNKMCNNFCAKLLEEENDVSIYVCIWDQTQSKNMWFVTIHQVIFFPFFSHFPIGLMPLPVIVSSELGTFKRQHSSADSPNTKPWL